MTSRYAYHSMYARYGAGFFSYGYYRYYSYKTPSAAA